MRLRPSPMVESMSSFAISLILVFGYYAVTYLDLNKAFSATTFAAVFYMFPMVTAWSIAGLIFRNRVLKQRMLISMGISALLSVCFALFFYWITVTAAANIDTSGSTSLIVGAVLVGVTGILGALVTYRFVIDDNKPTLAKSAYTTISNGQPQPVQRKSKTKKKTPEKK